MFEFEIGTLQNLFWKTDSCLSCSGQSNITCANQSRAIKMTSCIGKGGQVDCSPVIQLTFSNNDKHRTILNSWYEVSKLWQYSLFWLFSNLKDSLTTRFNKFV